MYDAVTKGYFQNQQNNILRTSGHFQEPIVRQLVLEFDLKLREGQSVESATATDPISGKVLKVDVSFAIVK